MGVYCIGWDWKCFALKIYGIGVGWFVIWEGVWYLEEYIWYHIGCIWYLLGCIWYFAKPKIPHIPESPAAANYAAPVLPSCTALQYQWTSLEEKNCAGLEKRRRGSLIVHIYWWYQIAKWRPNFVQRLALRGSLNIKTHFINAFWTHFLAKVDFISNIFGASCSCWRDHSSAAAPLPIIVTGMQFENYTHKIIPNLSSCWKYTPWNNYKS